MLVLSRVVRATSTVVGPAGRRALSLSGSRTRVTMDGMEAKAARAEAMVATLRERLNVLRSLVEQVRWSRVMVVLPPLLHGPALS